MATNLGQRRPSLEPRGEDLRRGILLTPQARAALCRGIETMAQAVAVTIGPLGRNVAIDPIVGNGTPEIVCEGSVVARRLIEIPNRYDNAGAMLIRHLAWHVRERAGDGSATAVVLARAMTRSGAQMVAAGANPMIVRRGLEKATQVAVRKLAVMAEPLHSRESISALARAACGDADLAAEIAEVFDTIGLGGVVMVEDYFGMGLAHEYQEGVRWDTGLVHQDFAADCIRLRTVVTDPLIALTTQKLTSASQTVPVLREVLKSKASGLVIIAPTIEVEALGTLSLNYKQGKLAIAPIKAPGPYANRPGIMADLATLTGATLIDEQAGLSMEGFRSRDFGRARRVVATPREFRIIGARGRQEEIHQRILNLRAEMESLNAQDKGKTLERLRRRLANLSGGAVVLRVGATSKGEATIKRSLAEDAVRSVECALEEGTLPGGGSAFLACVPELETLARATEEPDEAIGVHIVAEALTAPLQQIATNAGYSGSTIATRMATQGPGYLFDAVSGRIVPANSVGILDSKKVMRIALEMAASTAAMILTTDAIVLTGRLGKLERRNGKGRLRGADTEP